MMHQVETPYLEPPEFDDDPVGYGLLVLDVDPELGPIALEQRDASLQVQRLEAPPATLAELEALGRARQCWQVWLHPRWTSVYTPADLDVGQKYACWQLRPSRVAIAILGIRPALDHTMGPWADAPDGRLLACALAAYRRALGRRFRRGAGQVGEELLRESLRASKRYVSATVPQLGIVESDYFWIRPLTDQEHQRKWLHRYDKHAAYLGAISSLRLGLGSPVHHGEAIPLDVTLPGYWLVDVDWQGSPLLPDPTRGRRVPNQFRSGSVPVPNGPRWLTTPTLELAAKQGAAIAVREAYVWEQPGRPLEPFYRQLRDARAALSTLDDPAARLALRAVKQVYQKLLGGWLDARWKRAPDELGRTGPLFRPDWRHAIIAQSRSNIWRRLPALEAAGLAPCAIRTDALYIASDEPDPTRAVDQVLPLRDDLGGYSWEGSRQLADVAQHFEGRGWLGRLQAAFGQAEAADGDAA